jgi:peroxiredoxin
MTASQQWRVVVAVVVALGGALWFGVTQLGDELVGVVVGSTAPAFRGKTITRPTETKSLADYKGQVILLNVWATWCGPCRVEMPSMEALHQAMGPRGLRVVAVSVDSTDTESLRRFVQNNRFSFEVLHDSLGLIKAAYQTTAVPETFVIAADGTIRKKSIGASDWNSAPNRALITALMAEAER